MGIQSFESLKNTYMNASAISDQESSECICGSSRRHREFIDKMVDHFYCSIAAIAI